MTDSLVLKVDQQDTLTEENYRVFFGLAVEVVVKPWEKYIMGMKFTEVRAISLSISNY